MIGVLRKTLRRRHAIVNLEFLVLLRVGMLVQLHGLLWSVGPYAPHIGPRITLLLVRSIIPVGLPLHNRVPGRHGPHAKVRVLDKVTGTEVQMTQHQGRMKHTDKILDALSVIHLRRIHPHSSPLDNLIRRYPDSIGSETVIALLAYSLSTRSFFEMRHGFLGRATPYRAYSPWTYYTISAVTRHHAIDELNHKLYRTPMFIDIPRVHNHVTNVQVPAGNRVLRYRLPKKVPELLELHGRFLFLIQHVPTMNLYIRQ